MYPWNSEHKFSQLKAILGLLDLTLFLTGIFFEGLNPGRTLKYPRNQENIKIYHTTSLQVRPITGYPEVSYRISDKVYLIWNAATA
jgi:hypothetical protein